uniref:Uncharacterized protein n=1 Tax=Oryza glumipatula TaxID=40148 RepID=A0A0E0BRN8_9ORYZ
RCRLLAAAGEPGSPSAGAFSTAAAASSRAASGDLGSPSAGSSSRAPARELWWAQGGNNPIQERWDGILAQGSPGGSYALEIIQLNPDSRNVSCAKGSKAATETR